MTATGELLNLPVAIPMRSMVSAYNRPQRRGAARYANPHRVYGLQHRERPDTLQYRANGYTTAAPDKGNIIDLFA
jgi:hypothetical protein